MTVRYGRRGQLRLAVASAIIGMGLGGTVTHDYSLKATAWIMLGLVALLAVLQCVAWGIRWHERRQWIGYSLPTTLRREAQPVSLLIGFTAGWMFAIVANRSLRDGDHRDFMARGDREGHPMTVSWFGLSGAALREALATPAPSASHALVPIAPRRVALPRAKPAPLWTAEAFHDASVVAKTRAHAACPSWHLEPESLYLALPGRYRSFKTERGTRIRTSGNRRYPAARYWPGGDYPPGVVAVPNGRREPEILHPLPRRGVLAVTDERAPLELTPEDWAEAAD